MLGSFVVNRENKRKLRLQKGGGNWIGCTNHVFHFSETK